MSELVGATVVKIVVDGSDVAAEFESLWEWLRHEQKLRGRLRIDHAPVPDSAMGLTMELAVVCAAACTHALAGTLSTWLVQRRSDVEITVVGPNGHSLSMSARRATMAEQEKLLRQLLEGNISPKPAGENEDQCDYLIPHDRTLS